MQFFDQCRLYTNLQEKTVFENDNGSNSRNCNSE